MAWLEGLTAVDLGISFENNKEFVTNQEMSEEARQEITYQGAFGTDGPVLRRIRFADEGAITFSAILLKKGVQGKMNDEDFLRTMRDFDVHVRRGEFAKTYKGCNWSRISIRSTPDQVTLDADLSVPGYVGLP